MEEGLVYLLVTVAIVVVTLGGYFAYLSGRARAARGSIEAAGKPSKDGA